MIIIYYECRVFGYNKLISYHETVTEKKTRRQYLKLINILMFVAYQIKLKGRSGNKAPYG